MLRGEYFVLRIENELLHQYCMFWAAGHAIDALYMSAVNAPYSMLRYMPFAS